MYVLRLNRILAAVSRTAGASARPQRGRLPPTAILTVLYTEGQISGEFERIGDARMIAFGILGMCNWLARCYDPRKQVAIDEIIETYFKLVSLGVVSRSSLLPTSNDVSPPP